MYLSFSGPELVTSTPKQAAKPSTTSFVARSEVSSLTPLTSSPVKRALLGRPSSSSLASPSGKHKADTSQRPSAIPSLESSQRHSNSQLAKSGTHNSININNKRTFDFLHSHPATEGDGRKSKKAKSVSGADVEVMPQTPRIQDHARPAVPTLTELLASVKRGKKKRPSLGKPQFHPFTSKPRSKGDRELLSAGVAEEDVPPFFDDLDGQFSGKSPHQEYDFYSHLDVLSSEMSLSAIANAPDDEEEGPSHPVMVGDVDRFVLDSPFRPLATSTQFQDDHHRGLLVPKEKQCLFVVTQPDNPLLPRGIADSWESLYAPPRRDGDDLPAPSTSKDRDDSLFPRLSFDSQFESAVAAQVEKVNKLLQRDVGYVSHEREEVEVEADPDSSSFEGGTSRRGSAKEGYGFGYGKAFEYDQSL